MKKYMIATVMLLVLTSSLQAEVSYSRIDAVDGSRSKHTSEEAELHQFVHLLEQALQQFDLESLAQLWKASLAAADHCALAGPEKSRFCAFFS